MKKIQKLIIISDTHNKHSEMDKDIRNIEGIENSILIHAGDFTSMGFLHEVENFLTWFNSLPSYKSLIICGNHEVHFESIGEEERRKTIAKYPDLIYLENSGVEIDGISFYGSPIQPTFFNWAFNVDRGPKIRAVWNKIPENTNILITHGGPYGYGDDVESTHYNNFDTHAGCKDLLDRVNELSELKLHIFGHLHQGYSVTKHKDGKDITFVNAAMLDDDYQYTHKPTIINYEY